MESAQTYRAMVAALDWQVALGADEAICDAPINRYALDPAPAPVAAAVPRAAAVAQPQRPPPPIPSPDTFDAPQLAAEAAAAAPDLAALALAQEQFELCTLKRGARSFVGATGDPAARVMIIGEAPGRAEDQAGQPFVGPAGALLDAMLAAIGLDRGAQGPVRGVYLTHVLPWRTAGAGLPDPADLAMMVPFLHRHIVLAQPDVLVLLGNAPCQALLGRAGITRLRGQWADVLGRPALATFAPEHLLATPAAKREAWDDMLALKARLRA